MPTELKSLRDQATALVPPIVCTLPHDVAFVRVAGPTKIFVAFYDGTCGEVDLSGLIASQGAGVFACLRDEHVFAGVHVFFGAVTWPGDIDLAPDAMYDALKRDGEWRL